MIFSDAQARDLVGLVLAQHCQPEDLLIKGHCARQIGHLNADVVDLHAFQAGLLGRRDGCRAARRRQHRQALNQAPARERSLFETVQQI